MTQNIKEDFYQSTKWAIQLLREATLQRVKEHLTRFGKNGRYRNTKKGLRCYRFRSTPLKNALKILDEHYMLGKI